jgi:hypothetical protein
MGLVGLMILQLFYIAMVGCDQALPTGGFKRRRDAPQAPVDCLHCFD